MHQLKIVETLISKYDRIVKEKPTAEPVPTNIELSEQLTFERQIGADGILFLLGRELDDIRQKYENLVHAADWEKMEQLLNETRAELSKVNVKQTEIRQRALDELAQAQKHIDAIKPQYEDFPIDDSFVNIDV